MTPSSTSNISMNGTGGGSSGTGGSMWPSTTPAVASGSTAPASGFRTNVTLQQLSGFGMRSLSIHGTYDGALLDVYFKIVVEGQVVYVSEVARSTLNPVWVPFQFEENALCDGPNWFSGTSFDIIIVRVQERSATRTRRKSSTFNGKMLLNDEDDGWQSNHRPVSRSFADETVHRDGEESEDGVNGGSSEVRGSSSGGGGGNIVEDEILHMNFNVRELEPLPIPVAEASNLPLNTCLFEFNGRCYVKREVIELLVETGVIANKHSRRKGSAIQLKEYSLHEGVENLEKILATRQRIAAMQEGNKQLKELIQIKLADVEVHVHKDQKHSELEERVKNLRRQVAEKKDALERLKQVMQDERKTFETDIHIPKALLSTMQMSMRYKDEKQGILERRCEVLRAAHKIRTRQAMLVKQLGMVYPIEYVGAGEYSIRGIRIANSDLTGGGRADEEMISTALGYIAHLVFMLSKYLHVNLRYKVVPYSSRSYLKDEINDPFGEYPLYKKGAERERHEKAIHFLKKNVEQLMFSRSLDPTQGTPILARLKALTDAESSWLLCDRDVNVNVSSSGSISGAIIPR